MFPSVLSHLVGSNTAHVFDSCTMLCAFKIFAGGGGALALFSDANKGRPLPNAAVTFRSCEMWGGAVVTFLFLSIK